MKLTSGPAQAQPRGSRKGITGKSMTGIMQIEMSQWPTENQPWALFYRIGDAIRERRKLRKDEVATNSPIGPAFGPQHREEEGSSRMVDEGCPNP